MLPRRELVLSAIQHLRLKVAKPASSGNTEAVIHCPYHSDRTPSMYINVATGEYHCFQCGRGGMIESLAKDLTGVSLYKLLDISYDEFSAYAAQHTFSVPDSRAEATLDHIDISIEGEVTALRSSAAAMQYLRHRGVTLAAAESMNMKVAVNARINGTRFTQRLLTPIKEKGKIVSIEGRDLTREAQPKVLYPKGSSVNTLFQLDMLAKEDPLYIVEGLIDLAVLRTQLEFRNSSCVFGANITARQVSLLNQFSSVVVIPDNDDAGSGMVRQLSEKLSIPVSVLPVPKTLNGIAIKDIGDIAEKARMPLSRLLQQKWLKYIRTATPALTT